MAQIVEVFLWVRKVPIHAVNTIVADDLAIQGARLSVALYWLCLLGIFWFQHNTCFNSNDLFFLWCFFFYSFIDSILCLSFISEIHLNSFWPGGCGLKTFIEINCLHSYLKMMMVTLIKNLVAFGSALLMMTHLRSYQLNANDECQRVCSVCVGGPTRNIPVCNKSGVKPQQN